MISYSEILKCKGIEFTENDIWLSIGATTKMQGWKLHLSTIQVEALELLRKVVPVLQSAKLPFRIALDEVVLAQLNKGELGASEVGKFMTIYPNTDEEALMLVQQLNSLTKGMRGPVIPSDIQLGDIVYACYGSHNPITYRDKPEQTFSYIYDGEGNLFLDAPPASFILPRGIDNPFIAFTKKEISNPDALAIFGPGYRLIDVIRHSPKGDVYQAIDLRRQELVPLKIIKQGKQFCFSDAQGRDIRDRLKHQAALHKKLHSLIRIPTADDYFEVNGDGYLPLEYIEGVSVESYVHSILQNRPWHCLGKKDQLKILNALLQLAKQLQKLHRAGYIHRGLSASNVWITEKEEVYLIDLESVWHKDSKAIPYENGKPGFISSNQRQGGRPEFADDVYALGCMVLLSLTGIDPGRLLHREGIRVEKLKGLIKGLLDRHYEIIQRSVDPVAKKRPSVNELQTMIESLISLHAHRAIAIESISLNSSSVQEVLILGTETLFSQLPSTADGLWLSPKLNSGQNTSELELRKSVHSGIAGILYLLSKIKKHTSIFIPDPERIQKAAEWCATAQQVADARMPGLYFGNAGVAVALSEAIDSGLIENSETISKFIKTALEQPTNWLDLTNGIAGQGIACLYLNEINESTGSYSDKIRELAGYLIQAQNEDGSWTTPDVVDGISGEILTGFAHGVSGIVYFLAEYAYRYKDSTAVAAVKKAVNWLVNQSYKDETGKLKWDYSVNQKIPRNWWSHGGPGIALTFLRLYELTDEKYYASIAEEALEAQPDELVHPNLSQCNGLSGLGEIYLEAYRVLKTDKWLRKANAIAQTMFQLSFKKECSIYWIVKDPNFVTADLMTGMGGVLHFYLRLLFKGNEIGFPLLLNPLKKCERRLVKNEELVEMNN